MIRIVFGFSGIYEKRATCQKIALLALLPEIL